MNDTLLQFTIGMFVVQFMLYLVARGFISFALYHIFKLSNSFNIKAYVTIYNLIMQVGNILISIFLAAFVTGKDAKLGLANLVAGAVLGIVIFIEAYVSAYIIKNKLKGE